MRLQTVDGMFREQKQPNTYTRHGILKFSWDSTVPRALSAWMTRRPRLWTASNSSLTTKTGEAAWYSCATCGSSNFRFSIRHHTSRPSRGSSHAPAVQRPNAAGVPTKPAWDSPGAPRIWNLASAAEPAGRSGLQGSESEKGREVKAREPWKSNCWRDVKGQPSRPLVAGVLAAPSGAQSAGNRPNWPPDRVPRSRSVLTPANNVSLPDLAWRLPGCGILDSPIVSPETPSLGVFRVLECGWPR